MDIVKQTKLVGIILKILNLEHDILLYFYCKEIKSILEFGAVVWSSRLTGKMSDQIERIVSTSSCVTLTGKYLMMLDAPSLRLKPSDLGVLTYA